jgi:hypothetical protein
MRRERPVNTFMFGPQTVTTKVRMMMPVGATALDVDVADLVEGEADGGRAGLEGRFPDLVGR